MYIHCVRVHVHTYMCTYMMYIPMPCTYIVYVCMYIHTCVHTWCTYIHVYIHDVHTHAMYIHDVHMYVHTWCTYMMCIHDVHTWCTYMMYIHDVHTCCTYMMYIHDVHTWCTYMMYIHDVHTGWTYRLYTCTYVHLLGEANEHSTDNFFNYHSKLWWANVRKANSKRTFEGFEPMTLPRKDIGRSTIFQRNESFLAGKKQSWLQGCQMVCIFSYQNSKFCYILEALGLKKIVILNDHLVYLCTVWSFTLFCSFLVNCLVICYHLSIWYIVSRNIWQPWLVVAEPILRHVTVNVFNGFSPTDLASQKMVRDRETSPIKSPSFWRKKNIFC
jgi:hypothetical protein